MHIGEKLHYCLRDIHKSSHHGKFAYLPDAQFHFSTCRVYVLPSVISV
jgi:hypothetical protein